MVKRIPKRNRIGEGAPYQRVGITNNSWWDSTQLDQFNMDVIGVLELAAMYGDAETARKLAEAADEWRAVNQATFSQRWREFWSSRFRRHHYNNLPHPSTGRVHRSIFDHKTRTKYFVEGRTGASWLVGLAIAGVGVAGAAALVMTGGIGIAAGAALLGGASLGAMAGRAIRSGRLIPRWPAALNRAMCRYMRSIPDPDEPSGEIAQEIGTAGRPGSAERQRDIRLRDRLSEQGKFLGRVTWDWPNQIGSQVVRGDWQHFIEVPIDQHGSLLESRVNLDPAANGRKEFRLLGSTDPNWYLPTAPEVSGLIQNSSYNTYPEFSGAIYQIMKSKMTKGFATARHMTEIADQADQVERYQSLLHNSEAMIGAAGRYVAAYATTPGGPPPMAGPPPGGWVPPPGPPPPRRGGRA